jgi:integrase
MFIVPLLLLTGCRKRELLDAKWSDLDLPRRTWRIPTTKTGKARHVPLSTAGLPEVRMHDLRHSMASNMVNAGRSIYEVAKVLGHTQLKTSQRCSHLSQETLLAAVDASAQAAGSGWGDKSLTACLITPCFAPWTMCV